MADVTITALSNDEAPTDYEVPPAQEIVIKLASALYDGTGAAGDFIPVLEVVSPDLRVVGSFPIGAKLTAGASAFVSWFPRGGLNAASTGGSGIQFNTDNEGGWLEIGVDDTVPGGGSKGILLKNSGTDNIETLLDVEALQQNPAVSGLQGAIIRANLDDGEAAHGATGLIASAGQFGGGPAIGLDARTSAGADLTGVKVELSGDVGANKKGLMTDSPVCFDADQGPATGVTVLAQLYLKAAGAGQHSLIARAGAVEVTLVTG